MQRHPTYTRDRIRDVAARVQALIYAEVRAPELLDVAGPTGRIGVDEAERLEFRPASLGEQFGPLWSTWWFRVAATVPEAWAGSRVDLLWVTHSESTLWVDGRSVQGLNSEPRRSAAGRAPARPVPRRRAARPPHRDGLQRQVRPARRALRERSSRSCSTAAEIARFDQRAWALFHDLDVLRRLEADAANGLDPAWAGMLLHELNRFCNVWDEDDRPPGTRRRRSWRGCYAAAQRRRASTSSRRSATPTSTPPGCGRSRRPTASACARSRAQAAYMDAYPEYRFACSQAQQYDVDPASATPSCTRASADSVAGGQWVPVGGTWVEPDCNLPSGESLVRQFLLRPALLRARVRPPLPRVLEPGRVRLHRPAAADHARRRHRPLPDPEALAGTASTSPSTTRSAGRGSTAREVLAHFPPADTYNADGDGRRAAPRRPRDYRDHDRSRHSLLVFGCGDGGGGPTPAMLETLRRVARPAGRAARPRSRTRERVLRRAGGGRRRPAGASSASCTSSTTAAPTRRQAAVKRGNRRGERRAARRRAPGRGRRAGAAAPYPRERLERAVAAAPAEPVPRHPARARRSPRSYDDARRDYAAIERRRARRRRRAGRARRRRPGDAGEHDRRSPRAEVATARTAAGLGRGAGRTAPARRRGAGRRRGDARLADGVVLENAPPARRARRATAALRALVERGERPRGAGRARQRARALRGPARPRGTPGTSTRSTWRRVRDCPPGAALRGRRGDAAARRGARSSGRSAAPARCARSSGSTPARARLEFHCEVDWHESAHDC